MNASAPTRANGSADRKPSHRLLFMGSLIVAGESIYMLPYMRKSFQTSMEATFELTSFQIGTLNALFGILALVCYLPGGWLADRFSARRLLTVSLLGTGLGGLYMASTPGYAGLLAVHAFWGVFTILTFWAALIKAVRLWSGDGEQGRVFGILDGGRGLVGALLASIRNWLRPIAAIGAGFIADRVSPSRAISGCFALLVVGWGSLAVLPPDASVMFILWAQVAATSLAVFALRGIYYALLAESAVPMHLTGVAVGAISMLGYTPDIFVHLVSGWLVDHNAGATGYRIHFAFMAGMSIVGFWAVAAINRRTPNGTEE